jgi:hypothetical protein
MGANGHETNNITANPQTQGAIDRAFSAASTPYQKEYVPQGMDQLTSAILGKVGARYGLNGGNPSSLNTNMKQQPQSLGGQSPTGIPPGAGGIPPGGPASFGGLSSMMQGMQPPQGGGMSVPPGMGSPMGQPMQGQMPPQFQQPVAPGIGQQRTMG